MSRWFSSRKNNQREEWVIMSLSCETPLPSLTHSSPESSGSKDSVQPLSTNDCTCGRWMPPGARECHQCYLGKAPQTDTADRNWNANAGSSTAVPTASRSYTIDFGTMAGEDHRASDAGSGSRGAVPTASRSYTIDFGTMATVDHRASDAGSGSRGAVPTASRSYTIDFGTMDSVDHRAASGTQAQNGNTSNVGISDG
jgi:hypothetical protein